MNDILARVNVLKGLTIQTPKIHLRVHSKKKRVHDVLSMS